MPNSLTPRSGSDDDLPEEMLAVSGEYLAVNTKLTRISAKAKTAAIATGHEIIRLRGGANPFDATILKWASNFSRRASLSFSGAEGAGSGAAVVSRRSS